MDRAPIEARERRRARDRRRSAPTSSSSRLRLRESAGRYFADVVVTRAAGPGRRRGPPAGRPGRGRDRGARCPGSDVVVHVEPRRRGLDLRDRVLAIALAEPLVKEAHDITIFEQDGAASVSLHLKFPAELDLRAAHEIAERVERGDPRSGRASRRADPPRAARAPAAARARGRRAADSARHARVERLVRERTGTRARAAAADRDDAGHVLFLTLARRRRRRR